MRMSRAATARSRTKIIEAAANMLRARGVEGASVAEVMQAAGMTHGGFYKHFDSKDALLAEATAAAFAEALKRFDARAAAKGAQSAAARYAADYLSPSHIAHPERGCPVATFGAEAERRAEALTPAFRDGVEALIERHAQSQGSRAAAIARLVALVGAVVTARAVGEGPLRDEILSVARGDIA